MCEHLSCVVQILHKKQYTVDIQYTHAYTMYTYINVHKQYTKKTVLTAESTDIQYT